MRTGYNSRIDIANVAENKLFNFLTAYDFSTKVTIIYFDSIKRRIVITDDSDRAKRF